MTALPTATLLISVFCVILSSDNGESSKPAGGSPLSTTLYFPDHRLYFIFLNAEDLSGLGMVPRSSQPLHPCSSAHGWD